MRLSATTYDQLLDAAEDIDHILTAHGRYELDLTPTVREWLLDELERIEIDLAQAAE
ncbi:MAG TPA: hypothetical protein VFA97_05725 [Gaiellaceae bacterium]|nr:hypothetical protein [Gaiellaceae bacterium]